LFLILALMIVGKRRALSLALRGWYFVVAVHDESASIAPGLKNRGLRSARRARNRASRSFPDRANRFQETFGRPTFCVAATANHEIAAGQKRP
jgi:hypothetical protein